MKKLITSLMALCAITLATQAQGQTILLEESFEGKSMPTGWSVIDNDGDGVNWKVDEKPGFWGRGGKEKFAARSESYSVESDKSLTPDNFLVTPELALSEGGTLSFWVCAQDDIDCAEHYAVYASSAGNAAADFTKNAPLHEETLTEKSDATDVAYHLRSQTAWRERVIEIPAGTKYIAFRHFKCSGQFCILLDDVKVTKKVEAAAITLTTAKKVGEKVRLRIDATGPVKIEGVKGTWASESTVSYVLTEQTVRIYGNISTLVCRENQLTALELNNAASLAWLDCEKNQLAQLDLSKNAALNWLNAAGNQLTSLSTKNNPLLKVLRCFDNQLAALDVSSNPALSTLYCYGNKITALDLSKNGELKIVSLKNNQIAAIDVTKCPLLEGLDCSQNQLKALDLSQNKKLLLFYAISNQLTSLDLSNNTALSGVNVQGNQLTSLDLKNNTALTWIDCSINKLSALEFAENKALSRIDCYSNQIKGEAMNKLVASLPSYNAPSSPSGNEGLYVIDSQNSEEKNVCTKKQVKVVTGKNWKVYDVNGKMANRKEYEGSEDVNEDIKPIALPYTEDFETCSAGALPKGWMAKDVDGDALNWGTRVGKEGTIGHNNSKNCVMSASWVAGKKKTPNNHLISPKVTGIKSIHFYVSASDANGFAEHYKVLVSSKDTPSGEADWKKIFEETLAEEAAGKGLEDNSKYQYRAMDVPEGTQWVSFVHSDCTDQYVIRLDDITFSNKLASAEGIEVENIKLATEVGLIVVDTPTAGAMLSVFSLEGKCIAKRATIAGENRIAVETGYYVLSVGSYKAKVYVP